MEHYCRKEDEGHVWEKYQEYYKALNFQITEQVHSSSHIYFSVFKKMYHLNITTDYSQETV